MLSIVLGTRDAEMKETLLEFPRSHTLVKGTGKSTGITIHCHTCCEREKYGTVGKRTKKMHLNRKSLTSFLWRKVSELGFQKRVGISQKKSKTGRECKHRGTDRENKKNLQGYKQLQAL